MQKLSRHPRVFRLKVRTSVGDSQRQKKKKSFMEVQVKKGKPRSISTQHRSRRASIDLTSDLGKLHDTGEQEATSPSRYKRWG